MGKIKKRRKTHRKIKDFSHNLISGIGDFILFLIHLTSASAKSYAQLMHEANLIMGGHNPRSLREAFFKIRSDGLLNKDNKITELGWQRIRDIIPQYQKERKWDGLWRVVVFDIPEDIRRKRNILRRKLKDLGFGRLQASVWISPYNFQEVIERVINYYSLNQFVVWAETRDLTMGEHLKDFTWRIWKLNKLNDEYKHFFKLLEDKKKGDFFKTSAYFSILKRDPQLPFELLSDKWLGGIAFIKASKILKTKGGV